MIQILSTKTLLHDQKEALILADFNVIEVDFIKTQSNPFTLNEINDNLIFTSQNAVQSFLLDPKSANLKSKNVFCVGIKTKIMLSESGYSVAAYTDYADDLAEIITLIYNSESFTFFSGSLRRETLPKALKGAKIKFNEIQVYETSLTPQKITTPVKAILFFSPSGIESYLKDNTITNETCFCIGTTTSSALEGITKNVIVAAQPTIEDVIEEVIAEYR